LAHAEKIVDEDVKGVENGTATGRSEGRIHCGREGGNDLDEGRSNSWWHSVGHGIGIEFQAVWIFNAAVQ
jgi:hypothetical protein